MGKRTTSGGRKKSSARSKGKSKSNALVYASKIEALAQDAKKLEQRVRTDIDRVSEDIGQLVAHEIDVGTAPKDLEKARTSSDKKDYKTARGHLDRASASLMKTAQPQVEKRIADAQARINAVERLGIVEADLGEQLGDARKLVKKGWLLPALESSEAAAKRAVELAQNQLTEVVSISEMNIKTAEKEGLDVYKSQEYLEMARSAVSDGDYEAAVEHTLLVQTSLDRARKGLTIDADSEAITIEDIVGEEDREYVEEIIRKGLDKLETDLGTLEEIRGLVSHPENMASKAKKALEDSNLGAARKLLREAHLATIRALRERLQDVLNAASERMKKAKRDGLNLQEIRSLHDQAIMKVDSYEFKDAYDAAMSIEDRLTTVKEEKEEIELSISDGEELIAELSELGTNESRAQELLEQARKNLDRGDFKKARLNIAKALSTAKTSTQTFINSYIIEVRNVLLSVRTVGGNIATARPIAQAGSLELLLFSPLEL